jgi:ABC-type Fe3+-hydroxamate transport system substrate-binding protein
MFSRLGVIISLAAMAAVTGCASVEPENNRVYGSSPSNTVGTPRAATYQGTVTRVDAPQRVIVMSDGRMYQVPSDSMVYVNGQPVAYAAVQPGTPVVLNNAQLVELRDGRYVLVQQPVTAVSGYRQTINGIVEEVNRNQIKVRTANERLEIPMKGANQTAIKKGDNVVIDFTFTPTAPAALPR